MGECSHCSGTGRCQDDYHSGSSLFGGEDEHGQSHPSLIGSFLDDCPSCGDSNTQWRPECPHCDGTGRDNDDFFPSAKRSYIGFEASVKEREHNEGNSPDHSSSSSAGTSSTYTSSSSSSDASVSAGTSSNTSSGVVGPIVFVAALIGLGAFLFSSSDDGPRTEAANQFAVEQQAAADAAQMQQWIAGFRNRMSKRGLLPIKYDEGTFENLAGEVEISSDMPDLVARELRGSSQNYEILSEPGLCPSVIGPLNQSDLSRLLEDKVALIKNPINGAVTQYYFSKDMKLRNGQLCRLGGAACTGIYACLSDNPRMFLSGVNPESDDTIIAIAKPLPSYFSFDDFSFMLKQCDVPDSTYRNVEVTLSRPLATALTLDRNVADDLLQVILTRTANLCPIKEKRPLVPTTHPLSNIDVAMVDPSGRRVLEVRTRQDGSW